MKQHKELVQQLLDWGAYRANIIPVESIEFEPSFRKLCESNACGMYGKSWMCPPPASDRWTS